MGDKSGIEWTDATWNPVTGCTKVSPGCKHCYAERLWSRLSAPGQPYAGRKFTDVGLHSERLAQPLRWQRPRRIFVNSMSDLFHEDIPDAFIIQVFEVMARAPRHIFQILTKRPGRMYQFLFDHWPRIADFPLKNVWLGVSVENQQTAEERIPVLLDTPAAIRFVSLEPLIDQVLLSRAMTLENHLDWVIIGCESGPKRRPMKREWVAYILGHCQDFGIPVFIKQMDMGRGVSHDPNDWRPYWFRRREYPLGAS